MCVVQKQGTEAASGESSGWEAKRKITRCTHNCKEKIFPLPPPFPKPARVRPVVVWPKGGNQSSSAERSNLNVNQ